MKKQELLRLFVPCMICTWRCVVPLSCLVDKVVSIVRKAREHAFMMECIFEDTSRGHSCERYKRDRRMKTIAEICRSPILSLYTPVSD
jgi:hypothetical protein